MRRTGDYLSTADAREAVVQFRVAGEHYRLIAPHGSTRIKLDVARPDEAQQGRPWLLHWERIATGRRVGVVLISTWTMQDEDLSAPLVDSIKGALRYLESGPAEGGAGSMPLQ